MKTPRRHILMLLENDFYPRDGRVRLEAAALTAAGYRVSVICPRQGHQPARERIDGVQVYRYPAPSAVDGAFGYVWEYLYTMVATFILTLRVFVREGFDAIHAHNPPDAFVAIAAPYKLLGKCFIYDHHDLAPEMYYARFGGSGNRWVHRALLALEGLSCRLADHVIATNESYKALEMARSRVPAERITIVRNAPDPQRLRPAAPDPALRRRAPTIIGYVGVMGVQDGLDYLLRALHYLLAEQGRADFCAVLVGDGDAVPALQVLVDRLGLRDHVLFTGWVDQAAVARYLSSADICVAAEPSNPYNDRSTMIKLMEYMALGKPIVSFDLPEHRYTALDAALYVPAGDERAFARALAALMDDAPRRQAMGARGRDRVENALAWRYSVPPLLDVYRGLWSTPYQERVPSV